MFSRMAFLLATALAEKYYNKSLLNTAAGPLKLRECIVLRGPLGNQGYLLQTLMITISLCICAHLLFNREFRDRSMRDKGKCEYVFTQKNNFKDFDSFSH